MVEVLRAPGVGICYLEEDNSKKYEGTMMRVCTKGGSKRYGVGFTGKVITGHISPGLMSNMNLCAKTLKRIGLDRTCR